MWVFYILFLLIGVGGMTLWGSNPVFCGMLSAAALAGAGLYGFGKGKGRKASVLLIPVCGVLCLAAGNERRTGGMEEYGRKITDAAAQIEKQNMDEGKALLDELDREYGITDMSCYARAEIYLFLEQYKEALNCMKSVEYQSSVQWYETMERILGLEGTEESRNRLEELYLSGAEELPDNGHLQYMAGLVLLERNSYRSAAFYLNRAAMLQEAGGNPYYYMGLICLEQGDREKASACFQEAVRLGVDQEKEKRISEGLE